MGFFRRFFRQPESADPDQAEEPTSSVDKVDPAEVRWIAGMPSCLLDFWEEMRANVDTVDYNRLRITLLEEYGKPGEIPLHLYKWAGSGVENWSDAPAYESVPEQLLWELPFSQLLIVFDDFPLEAPHLEGAARFFSSDLFVGTRGGELAQVPMQVARPLLQHVMASKDLAKIERLKRALPQSYKKQTKE